MKVSEMVYKYEQMDLKKTRDYIEAIFFNRNLLKYLENVIHNFMKYKIIRGKQEYLNKHTKILK
jgi:hypothetical protein